MTKKEPLTKKVGRKLKELYYGPKTYAKKDFSPGSGEFRKLKEGMTKKEKEYVDVLRKAGATAKEISKFFE